MGKLTDKQQAFVYHYAQCLNATEAARLAGYSERTAHAIGWENLRKPEIRSKIDALLNARAMTAEEVVSRLSDQARGIPADCFTTYGPTIAIDFEKLREHGLLHLIKKLSYNADGHPVVEFYGSQRALAHLGKIHALFVDRQRTEDWRSDAIAAIRKGEVSYEALAYEFDTDLATELFKAAGVPIEVGTGAGADVK